MEPQPIFCKPPGENTGYLFETRNKTIKGRIQFRSLDLAVDLPVIHDWTTQPYTARFWQLNVDPAELNSIYQSMLANPLAHSFIGTLDEKMVCQVDCYHVSAEEIKEHIADHGQGNCGLHILMLPPRESQKGLTEAMLKAFTEFYFSFDQARTLYGEPDTHNQWGNIAAKRAGFHFQKTISLSYKTANLYSITRDQYFNSLT